MESFEEWKKKKKQPQDQGNTDPLSSFDNWKKARASGVDTSRLAQERAQQGQEFARTSQDEANLKQLDIQEMTPPTIHPEPIDKILHSKIVSGAGEINKKVSDTLTGGFQPTGEKTWEQMSLFEKAKGGVQEAVRAVEKPIADTPGDIKNIAKNLPKYAEEINSYGPPQETEWLAKTKPIKSYAEAKVAEQQATGMDTGSMGEEMIRKLAYGEKVGEGLTGGIIKAEGGGDPKDFLDKLLSGVSEGIGMAGSFGLLGEGGGVLYEGLRASKLGGTTSALDTLMTKFPKVAKYAAPMVKNAMEFSAYKQLDPALADDFMQRMKSVGIESATSVLYTPLGFIKKFGYSVPAAFTIGWGMASLSGAKPDEAVASGFALAFLDLAGKQGGEGDKYLFKGKQVANSPQDPFSRAEQDPANPNNQDPIVLFTNESVGDVNKWSDIKLKPNSTPEEVSQARRSAGHNIHPDKFGGDDAAANEEMTRVNNACDFLIELNTQKEPAPAEPPLKQIGEAPKYNPQTRVKDFVSALENNDTKYTEENVHKLSKDDLDKVYQVLDQASQMGASADVESDKQYIKDLIDERASNLKETAGEIVSKGTTDNLENPVIHPEDVKHVNTTLDQVGQATGQEAQKVDNSAILPAYTEYGGYHTPESPFVAATTPDEVNATWDQKTKELDAKSNEIKKQKNDLLASKKATTNPADKKAIQTQIDEIDKTGHEVADQRAQLENQAIGASANISQKSIDEIKKLDPSFDLQQTIEDNWDHNDYVQHLESLKQEKGIPDKESLKEVDNKKPEKVAIEKPKATENKKYFINELTDGKAEFKEVKATPVVIPGHENLDLFIHKSDKHKDFVITEGRSGMTLGVGERTKKGTLEAAKIQLDKNKDRIDSAIEGAIKERGESPRYLTTTEKSAKVVSNKYERSTDHNLGGENRSGANAGTSQVGKNQSKGIGKYVAKNEQQKPSVSGVGNGELGKRYADGQRLTKLQIEELVQSKSKFSDEEKAILRSYEGSGGTAEGEGRGVLDEFYTPKPIVDKMWGLVKQNLPLELEGNLKVLEPSAGTGRFIESAPTGTDITAYETNPISAKITKVLNPETKIVNKPFEDMFMDEKGGKKVAMPIYDVVIGNPPYGIHRGKYKGLGEEKKLGRYEEYFIKRALDVTKEDGIVAMIVPSGFLRGKFDYAKGQIAMRGDLVDAYRLPNKSFKSTDIGTDILIIKKHDYLASADQVVGDIWANDTYFKSNPDKVLGTETEKSGKFGMVKYIEGKLDEALGQIDAVDVAETRQDTIEQVNDNLAQIEEEQPVTAAVRKEAVRSALKVAKTKTKAQKKGDNNKLYLRDEQSPYILDSIKKDGTKIFLQGGAVEHTSHVLEDGSIDEKYVKSLSQPEFVEFNQQDGKYYNDFNYLQGDIYDKLQQLEIDKVSKISQKQYEKQKAKLDKILPPEIGIKEITLLPIDKLASEIKVSYDGEKDRKLQEAFSSWVGELPYDALEGSSRWEIDKYLDGIAVRGGSKEQNIKEKNRRRQVANKLFKKFYTEELPEKEQKKITDRFNKNFNGYVRPDYREYPLSIELNSKFYGKDFELKEIQKEGAAFLVNKGVGLLGYEVGVGKTLTAIAAIAEVMKKGWAKRPLIVVPKNLKSKWINDLMESMPNVKINDLSNLGGQFKYKGEPEDLNIEDGSLTIITEDGFKRIGYNQETYDELTRNLKDVTYKLGDKSKRDREIEGAQAEEIQGKAMKGTDYPKTFEEFGFDHLTVDEAHRAKNIFASAQASKDGQKANEYGAVRGAVSERGLKTYLAAQYILAKNGGRNVFLMTATPFNNQPIEVYSMLSLMAKKRLESLGISNVNEFISLFCELENKFAIKANGQVMQTDQVRRFNNARQLQKLIREFMDVRTGEEAGIARPTKQKLTPTIKMNEMQAKLVVKAQELFKDKEGGVLQAITELQKITLSPYLSQFHHVSYTPTELVENSPKIQYVVESIKAVHKTNPNAGQIIFSEKGVDVFRPLREYFIDVLKYKPAEVAIIDSSISSDVKDDIQDRFQNGEVKILIASGTVKEGVDLQRNSTDLYNMFLQWNPTDMIQAEGRTWRQGSFYDNVRIHYPLLENSVDPFIFQKLEEKASRISDIFSYKGDSLDVSDIDFENLKFELITDPVLRVQAEETFARAEHDSNVRVAEAELAFMERKAGKVQEIKDEIKNYEDYKKQARARDDADDINYYGEKIVKANKELADEQKRLKNKGVNVEELKSEIEKKKAEVEALQNQGDKIREKFTAKMEKAQKQGISIKTGKTDYAALTMPYSEKSFFTHEGDIHLKGLPGKFKLSEADKEQMLAEAPNIPVELIKKVSDLEREWFGDNKLQFTRELRDEFGALGLGRTRGDMIAILDAMVHDPLKTFPHESVHKWINSFATPTEKFLLNQESKRKWGTTFDEKEEDVAIEFEDEWEKAKEKFNQEKPTSRIRQILRRIIERIKQFFGFSSAIKQMYYDIVSGEARKRGLKLSPEFEAKFKLWEEGKLRKSGEPKDTEKRRVYAEAFNKVFGDQKPPSLGKMVEEEFKVKERRTMINAQKLEAIGMKTFKTAFSEGKEVGYLKGQTDAITQTEKDIEDMKGKLDRSEYKNQEQRAMMEVRLDELTQKHREQKDEMMAKMDKQAERFKRQKEKLREKLKLRMVNYRQVRKEMVDYIKDNLPRKSWSKFLIAVRDGKTPAALEKVVSKVDAEVSNLQRVEAIASIKKIIAKAETLPIEAQMMIKAITDGIHWKGVLPDTIKQLERVNNYLKNNPDAKLSMPMRILRRLGILEKKSFKDLTTEQVIAINARLERIKQVGKAVAYDRKVLRIVERTRKLDRLMTESVNHDIFKQSGMTAEDREKITAWQKFTDKLQTADWQVMPIDSFMQRLDNGKTNGANYELIKKPVDVGFNEYWRTSKDIKNRLWDFLGKVKETQKITDKEWERIGIYAISEQKGGRAKLKGSGYTDDQIDAIKLTDPEMALYGYMRGELDAMFPTIKDVYEKTYNKELPGVENYFPFIMDWGNRQPIYQEFEAEFNFGNKGTEKGFTVSRKGGFNPVKVNALEAFIDHIDKATYFVALEPTVKEVRDLVKSHRYGAAVGEKAQGYVMKWVELIERHGTPKDPKDIRALDIIRKNVTWGVLAFKLTTIPIQLTAVFNGASEVGLRAGTGFTEYMTSSKAADFILKASPQMEMRVGDDPVYKEVSPNRKLHTAREIGMWGIKKFDYATTAGVWLGAYRQFLSNHEIEFSYDDIIPEAAMYADKIVRKTQATADYKDLPPLLVQRSRSIGKLLLQFQNFPLFQWAYSRNDVKYNLSENKSKAAWQMSMILINILVGNLIRDLIARGIYKTGKEDEESTVSKMAWQLAQTIPIAGNLMYGVHGLINYGSTANMLSGIPAVDTFIKGSQALGAGYIAKSPETKWKNYAKAAAGVGTLLGVPGAQQAAQIIQGQIPPASKGKSKYSRYGG